MKVAYNFVGIILAMASFNSTAGVITDKVDEIFVQCASCTASLNSDSTLGYVKIALSAYASAASSNGWNPVQIGNEVQVERYTQTPGGYVLVDHYYVIKNLPVQSFDDLIDEGFERDSDVRAVAARVLALASIRGDLVSFVESFADVQTTTSIYAFFKQN
jgi:hypothetical protein